MMTLTETLRSVIITEQFSFLNILPFLFILTACIGLLFWPIAYFMFGRRFDKLFKDRPCPSIHEGVFIMGTMSRTLAYAQRMILGTYCVRNRRLRNVYDGYDFRAHSTKAEFIVAWIYYRSGAVAMWTAFIIFLITGWRYVAQFF